MSVSRVLVANRGEIAVRIIRACRTVGIETVLVVSEADRDSLPARLADQNVCIGPADAAKSYLNVPLIVTAALEKEADAIHPGYGFLSESPELAEACAENGIKLIGPNADHIRQMGNKLVARTLAQECNVPILKGSEKISSYQEAEQIVDDIGLPVMLKAAAGGGGRGMKIVKDRKELKSVFESASREAQSAFGDATLYVERYIENARHIEVQVLGDRFGNVIHLGERDCSLQRRHQKLVEEATAPNISDELRRQIQEASVRLAKNISYENAGTVEFIVDQDAETFYFLEMNTRIQVEHPVTEQITGVDLIQEQLKIAGGEPLGLKQSDVKLTGHAIECRINAESPEIGFQPTPGLITEWQPPLGPGVRLDTYCTSGYRIPIFYDSLIGKLIVHGNTRLQALKKMELALEEFSVSGVETTVPFLKKVIRHPDFVRGDFSTRFLEKFLNDKASFDPTGPM